MPAWRATAPSWATAGPSPGRRRARGDDRRTAPTRRRDRRAPGRPRPRAGRPRRAPARARLHDGLGRAQGVGADAQTTVLPLRSTPAASAKTLGRPSKTKPTTPSGEPHRRARGGRRRQPRRPATMSARMRREHQAGGRSVPGGRRRPRRPRWPRRSGRTRRRRPGDGRRRVEGADRLVGQPCQPANACSAASTAVATSCSAAGDMEEVARVLSTTSRRSPAAERGRQLGGHPHPVAPKTIGMPGSSAPEGSAVPSGTRAGGGGGSRRTSLSRSGWSGHAPSSTTATQMVKFGYAVGDHHR